MDWFERLTGFAESGYAETQKRLRVADGRLHSDASEKTYAVGTLTFPSLADLRLRARSTSGMTRLKLSLVSGDVRDMHAMTRNAGALFQVASQFNVLEMMGPSITPEHGVTGYEDDHTQGPACAIAAGAATIYRNYLVPVGDQTGQTATRQVDCLAGVGAALSVVLGRPADQLWQMRNGYAMATPESLRHIGAAINALPPEAVDDLRGRLNVGAQYGVEVTDFPIQSGQTVSQVFCSALPIGYCRAALGEWEPFARIVLEAAYEATLHCAEINTARSGSNKVYLTLIGAGAFGNPREWVLAALSRALEIFRDTELDVAIVSHGAPEPDLKRLAAEFELGGSGR